MVPFNTLSLSFALMETASQDPQLSSLHISIIRGERTPENQRSQTLVWV